MTFETDKSDTTTSASEAERSELAQEIDSLKANTLRAIQKRELVPHPLFWSLFLNRVAGIRGRKAKRALLSDILE